MKRTHDSPGVTIKDLTVRDIRFPTHLQADGSDAVHTDPDYSATYITLHTDDKSLTGNGITFTLGRGNEIVIKAIESYKPFVVGKTLNSITSDFGGFYRTVTQESQLRWLGPEKGVTHLAIVAIFNSIWDLWAKSEKKPVWRLLVDLTPEEIVSCIDFQYIDDALTREEAIQILRASEDHKKERIEKLKKEGYPAYTTSIGWLGYSDEKIEKLCKEALASGFTLFKMKVGQCIEDDKRRGKIIRKCIGEDKDLAMDANQRWSVNEAISNMQQLKHLNPYWIEEPTNPDDILGHATIAKALHPIRVATGEHAHNRIMFKQLLQAKSISVCQIDSCRVCINENLSVILMAKKFGIPVVPHAGGVGLCEYVQHLAYWDYVSVSGTAENKYVEYVDHLHEHFENPCIIKNARYFPPEVPGYSIDMKKESLDEHEFPNGSVWKKLASQ